MVVVGDSRIQTPDNDGNDNEGFGMASLKPVGETCLVKSQFPKGAPSKEGM